MSPHAPSNAHVVTQSELGGTDTGTVELRGIEPLASTVRLRTRRLLSDSIGPKRLVRGSRGHRRTAAMKDECAMNLRWPVPLGARASADTPLTLSTSAGR